MKKSMVFCIFFLVLSTAAHCGQVSRIELTDGSVLNGEIVSYANGMYVINTEAFGEMKVAGAKVARIESANSSSSGTPMTSSGQPGSFSAPQFNAYKEKLMSNPQNAAVITGLAADPQMQEVAKDPQIQEAIRSGNIQALMENEKFMEMVNSPSMQEAVRKLKQ